jgi:hypothetical protein
MSNNRKARVSVRTRMAGTEIRFALMLVDICRMEMALGDVRQAERALADARGIGEVVGRSVQTRGGVRTPVRAGLVKLAKELDLLERTLREVRTAVAGHTAQEPMEDREAPDYVPAIMARTANAGC